MNTPAILLVEPCADDARRISAAIEQLALRGPRHLSRGEEAIKWIREQPCDVCLLSYDVPEISGLDLLVRLHQHRPDLPVIMLSADKSAESAVAAFHFGAVDYIIKKPGYHDIAAQRAVTVAQARSSLPANRPATQGAPLPDGLSRLNYANRLRVIGRRLDTSGYRSINLLEVGGGFLVRAMPAVGRTPEALEFLDRDFPQQMASVIASRVEARPRMRAALLPSGYEQFLWALGDHLDQQLAEAVTVAELDGLIVVGGIGPVDAAGDTTLAPFQSFLRADDIGSLIQERLRRGTTSPQGSRSVIDRLFGRT